MSKEKNPSNLPSPAVGGLSIYLAQIKKFPMLDAEEEYMLAKNWKDSGNIKSAHKLYSSGFVKTDEKVEDILHNHQKLLTELLEIAPSKKREIGSIINETIDTLAAPLESSFDITVAALGSKLLILS